MQPSFPTTDLVCRTSSVARTASFDDPISSFSSSPGERAVSTTVEFVDTVPTPIVRTVLPAKTEFRALNDESDDENLPEVGHLLKNLNDEKAKAAKQQELREIKLRLAAKAPEVADDDDDDLEITGTSETKGKDIVAERGIKQKPSEGRKRQMALGGISLAQQRAKQRDTPPKPLALAGVTRTQEQLTKDLQKLVAQKNVELTKQKEDEWLRRGGRVAEAGGDADDLAALRNAALKEIAEKGQKTAEARESRMQVDFDEEDDSDEEWSENRGSASPRPQEDSDADAEDADITMVNEDDEDAENEAPSQLKSRAPRRSLAIIDSDSENDENAPLEKPASFALRHSILGQEDHDENVSPINVTGVALHRGSVSSMDERTEDEGDKENNTHLMYDRSEDKENKAVPRHPFGARPVLGRQGSLFGLEEGIQRRLSMSPGDKEEPISDGDDENDAGGDRRRPLQNLLADEDPFLVEPPLVPVNFADRLQQASPLPLDAPESTLRPSFDAGSRIGGKTVDESASFKGSPLEPGFSDLFESGTEQPRLPKRPLGLSASFSGKVSPSDLFTYIGLSY
jgi:mediator of replication checkpoint protein 1